MSKTKNKPGIHLFMTMVAQVGKRPYNKKEWFWHIVSKNGRIIARSSETYSSKRAAVKSIRTAAAIFCSKFVPESNGPIAGYYDHSKPDSPLNSYL